MPPMNTLNRHEYASLVSDFGFITGLDFTDHETLIERIVDANRAKTIELTNEQFPISGIAILAVVIHYNLIKERGDRSQNTLAAAASTMRIIATDGNIERIGRLIRITKLAYLGPAHVEGTEASAEQVVLAMKLLLQATFAVCPHLKAKTTWPVLKRMGLSEEGGRPEGIIQDE